MDQGDGIDDELNALVRMASAQAALIIEEISRVLERNARIAEADARQRAAEDQQRMDAELAAMHAQVRPALGDEWWKKATPERIGTTYETAAGFAPYDDLARQVAERIRDEVQKRYGFDVEHVREDQHAQSARETGAGKNLANMTADERHVSYLDAQRALAAVDPDRSERIGLQVLEARTEAESIAAQNEAIEARRQLLAAEHAEQNRDEQNPNKITLAEAELAAAAAADRAAVERAARVEARAAQIDRQATAARNVSIVKEAATMIEGLKTEVDEALAEYDTPERRARTEAALHDGGSDAEAVEARMLDDMSNALPPSAAATRRRNPRARKTRGGQETSRDLEQGR